MLLIFIIATIAAGNLVGYVIRQIESPEYPMLNLNFIFDTLSAVQSYAVWAFLGILAGNYKREFEGRTLTL